MSSAWSVLPRPFKWKRRISTIQVAQYIKNETGCNWQFSRVEARNICGVMATQSLYEDSGTLGALWLVHDVHGEEDPGKQMTCPQ